MVTSPAGEMEGTAVYSRNGRPGVVYLYHGNKKGEANNLIDRNYLDPYTGFPGYKSYFCKIEKQGRWQNMAYQLKFDPKKLCRMLCLSYGVSGCAPWCG